MKPVSILREDDEIGVRQLPDTLIQIANLECALGVQLSQAVFGFATQPSAHGAIVRPRRQHGEVPPVLEADDVNLDPRLDGVRREEGGECSDERLHLSTPHVAEPDLGGCAGECDARREIPVVGVVLAVDALREGERKQLGWRRVFILAHYESFRVLVCARVSNTLIIRYHVFTKVSMRAILVKMKKFQVVTLFPDMLSGVFGSSMMWKAQKDGLVELSTIDLREFGLGPRRQVDDTPYGGGDGMLLMIEPLWNAVMTAKANDPTAKVLLMTPRGPRWTQAMAQEYSESGHGYIFICGRYEGYDERIMELVDEEIRVGDYVLTGGELPAMTIVDSVVRLIPGVLGGEQSAAIESFADGETLEFPQYTRPEEWHGRKVPSVLLSGNHGEIAKWRAAQSKKAV